MSHYAGRGFEREPFGNSPDPSFLLDTRQHATCLQELEISLRLRRGLNLVTGDIGTGKTTLCRSLLRAFAADEATDVHLILDPHFASAEEFLRVLLSGVCGAAPEPGLGLWALKEALKQQLFRLGLVEKRLVILVIDEGQKISPENLEILRELLNYETNTSKLLQIVIFGQRELEPIIDAMPNLADRINVRRRLAPLSLAETRRMIAHRLSVASGGNAPMAGFSPAGELAVHFFSGGSPRKTVRLCHMAMLEMLVRGKTRAGLSEVLAARRGAAKSGVAPAAARLRKAGLVCGGLCAALGALWLSLGTPGPVLNPAGQGGQGQAPAAATQAPAAPVEAADSAQQPGISVERLRLAGQDPEVRTADQAPAAAEGVTLLPQRDHGPAMRELVAYPRPAAMHGEADQGANDLGVSGEGVPPSEKRQPREAAPARPMPAPSEQAALDKAHRLALKTSNPDR